MRTNKKNKLIFFETFITYPVCVFVKKTSWNKSQLTIHVRMIETICALKERVNYQNFHHTTSQVFLQNMVIFVKTLVFFFTILRRNNLMRTSDYLDKHDSITSQQSLEFENKEKKLLLHQCSYYISKMQSHTNVKQKCLL